MPPVTSMLFHRPDQADDELRAVCSRHALEFRMSIFRIRDDADGEKRDLHARGDAGRIGALHVLGIGAPGFTRPAGKIDLPVEGVSGADISHAQLAFFVRRIARGGEQGRVARKCRERFHFAAADAQFVRHRLPLGHVDAGAGVFVIRFIAAEIHRVRAEHDIEDFIVGIVRTGRTLIDDRRGMKTVDREGCRSGRVDGALFRAGDYDRFSPDTPRPPGPAADLDLVLALKDVEERRDFEIDGAFDKKVVSITGKERSAENEEREKTCHANPMIAKGRDLQAELAWRFSMKSLKGLKVAILITDGFEQVEMERPRKALDDAGADTRIVSPKHDEVRGWKFTDWGDTFPVDVPLDHAQAADFDALLLPGGVINPDKLRMLPEAVWNS